MDGVGWVKLCSLERERVRFRDRESVTECLSYVLVECLGYMVLGQGTCFITLFTASMKLNVSFGNRTGIWLAGIGLCDSSSSGIVCWLTLSDLLAKLILHVID